MAINYELVATMPWLVAEPFSIWRASGTYGAADGTFTDCWVIADDLGDGVFFRPISPRLMSNFIPADRITHARRLRLVDDETGEEVAQ